MLSIEDESMEYTVEARLPLPIIYTPFYCKCGHQYTNVDAYNNKCLSCNKQFIKTKVTNWIGTIPWRYWRPIYVRGTNVGVYPPPDN